MKNTILYLAVVAISFSCSKNGPEPLNPPAPEPKAPTIASLSLTTGHPETEVTINGADFGSSIAANEVKFNGVAAEVKTATSSKLVVKVPVLAGTGVVTVKTTVGTATGPNFEYLPDTLLAGTEYNRVGSHSEAKYWKNGVGFTFFGDTQTSVLNDMVISGADMYAVGQQWNGTVSVAMLWKNGVSTKLTDGTHDALAQRVKVVGSDVYVVGDEKNDNYSVAKYWKNGVAVSLSDGLSSASAWDLAVSGTDVYAVGSVSNISRGMDVAVIWKNGVASLLSPDQINATATQVALSGTDVFVAGVMDPSVGNYQMEAVLWKNGVKTSLSNGNPGSATHLVLSNGDVYVAGRHDGRRANYWKNGQEVFLNDGTNMAYVHGLFISGNDVYGVGEEFVNDYAVGRYWKNGTAVSLGNTNTDVYMYRIAIR